MKVKHRWHVAEEYEGAPRIDKAAGVIYNVLVLGKRARNKRRYTEEAMEEAVHSGKYEHLQVYIGPHKKSRFAKRSPNDHGGELRNTRLAKDGVRGDLHYNRVSRGGQLVLEIAERFPKRFGLSHHADVAGYVENGEKIITRILEVTVADVIKDPATTDNVFEDVETPKAKSQKQVREEASEEELGTATEPETDEAVGGWASCLKTLIGELHDDDTVDDDLKMKVTKQLLKIKKMLNGTDEDSEDEEDDEEAEEGAEPKKGAEEAVDVRRLIKREFKQLVSKLNARTPLPAKKRTNVPRSSARSGVTEDVTPKPKPKAAEQLVLRKRDDIIDVYSED